jgi:purine-nucleoside phosphorylase
MTGAAEYIRAALPSFAPATGLILGSGLGDLAEAIEPQAVFDYGDLPGFPSATAPSHRGRLILGTLAGHPVACMQGRIHLYEGVEPAALAVPVRTLKALGCARLIVTNAAGSLDPAMAPGALMAITDHINLMGANPLAAPHDEADGPRFFPMNDAYAPALRALARQAVQAAGITLHEGVYLAVTGPNFETPAEIRAFRTLGADAVGMSTVPEVIVAAQAGLPVLGLSMMTNMAAGLAEAPPTAQEVHDTAATAAGDMGRLIEGVLERLV